MFQCLSEHVEKEHGLVSGLVHQNTPIVLESTPFQTRSSDLPFNLQLALNTFLGYFSGFCTDSFTVNRFSQRKGFRLLFLTLRPA